VLTFDELAAYCGPIVWFSPDEPLLTRERGKAIRLPMAFPFETQPDSPVVYYRIDDIVLSRNSSRAAVQMDADNKGRSTMDLRFVKGITIKYLLYYPSEAGLGGHVHDLEVVDMKIAAAHLGRCPECPFAFAIQRIVGRAHGVLWYNNHLTPDAFTKFPIGMMVEEGKHANCPDKNLDGMYTPGVDVNHRVNDAWGVRDIISTGSLYSGGFESWMNKVRVDEDRVFPPLPDDSPLRTPYTVDGVYAPDNAIYTLRAVPPREAALPDEKLEHFIADKGENNWPHIKRESEFKDATDWLDDEAFVKSLSIAFRADGEYGISFVFPLFIFRNFEDPIGGGWLVNRIYFQDKGLRDFGWNVIYSPSASRWIDGYFSIGLEVDREPVPGSPDETKRRTLFTSESGIKFRANMAHTSLKFMSRLTDFWGLRVGLKYSGNATDFERIGYVVEIGAGVF
jgi:hypothetical protein